MTQLIVSSSLTYVLYLAPRTPLSLVFSCCIVRSLSVPFAGSSSSPRAFNLGVLWSLVLGPPRYLHAFPRLSHSVSWLKNSITCWWLQMYLSSPDFSTELQASIPNHGIEISIWMSSKNTDKVLSFPHEVYSPCSLPQLNRPQTMGLTLTLICHVQSVHKYYCFYLQNKSRSWPFLNISPAVNMVQVTFNSHQNYCTILLTSLPAYTRPSFPSPQAQTQHLEHFLQHLG